jgi:hypothetical protein
MLTSNAGKVASGTKLMDRITTLSADLDQAVEGGLEKQIKM